MRVNSFSVYPWQREEMRHLYSDGMTANAIGERMGISRDTVRHHVQDIEPPKKVPLKPAEIRDYLQGWR